MSVFDQTANTTTTQTTTTETIPSVFDELVGDGKKFKTPEDLAKGKQESDKFIEQLKEELSGLREELDKRMTSEEVLQKIQEAQQRVTTQGENTTPQFSKENLSELVKQTLESTRTEETRTKNINAVDQDLLTRFGDKAGEWLFKKSTELEMSIEELQMIAARSPKAFFNTVGLDSQPKTTTSAITKSSVNTVVMEQNNGGSPKPNTKRFFDNLRKEDPKRYWTPDVQNQIFKARKELGEKFYE